MDISTGHVVLVSISRSSTGEDSLCEKVDDAHQKIWIKFLQETIPGMSGAAFIFGFECTLEDTLVAKDSGVLS